MGVRPKGPRRRGVMKKPEEPRLAIGPHRGNHKGGNMAEEKKSYPMLPIAHWWTLRKKFKQSIPGVVTDRYLATVLAMGVNSARANVLPFLKALGIIDDEGKTLERARLWRDDGHYGDVCKAMLKEVYPEELLEAVPNPRAERAEAQRWFASQTGAGKGAVGRMTALYALLAEADASKQQEQDKKADAADSGAPQDADRAPERGPAAPAVNINLQIHISADATPDQIDQIFASMAKHIYKRG